MYMLNGSVWCIFAIPGGYGSFRGGGGGVTPPPHRCIRREGALEAVPGAARQAVGGGYCRFPTPLKPALAVRETVAGHQLGSLDGGLPPFQCIPTPLSPSDRPPFTDFRKRLGAPHSAMEDGICWFTGTKGVAVGLSVTRAMKKTSQKLRVSLGPLPTAPLSPAPLEHNSAPPPRSGDGGMGPVAMPLTAPSRTPPWALFRSTDERRAGGWRGAGAAPAEGGARPVAADAAASAVVRMLGLWAEHRGNGRLRAAVGAAEVSKGARPPPPHAPQRGMDPIVAPLGGWRWGV